MNKKEVKNGKIISISNSEKCNSWEQRKLSEYLETSTEKNAENTFEVDDVLSVSGDYGVVNQIEFQGRSFAGASKHGDVFKALYEGQDLQGNHSNSDMSLMNRLAYWCNGDKEQMIRIFATSGLYREGKSPDYYEGTAIKAIRDTSGRFQPKAQTPVTNKPIVNGKEGK